MKNILVYPFLVRIDPFTAFQISDQSSLYPMDGKNEFQFWGLFYIFYLTIHTWLYKIFLI